MSLEAWGRTQSLVSACHLEKSEDQRLDGGDCKREDRSVVSEDMCLPIGHRERQPGFRHLERILTKKSVYRGTPKSQFVGCTAKPSFGYLLGQTEDIFYLRKY